MIVNKKIHVRGKVQGVFYRASAKIIADDLSLTGWIKNEPDESVSIYVSGEIESVLEFISWCELGPALAVVESVTSEEVNYEECDGFKIRTDQE